MQTDAVGAGKGQVDKAALGARHGLGGGGTGRRRWIDQQRTDSQCDEAEGNDEEQKAKQESKHWVIGDRY
jgi:hypothetical protein